MHSGRCWSPLTHTPAAGDTSPLRVTGPASLGQYPHKQSGIVTHMLTTHCDGSDRAAFLLPGRTSAALKCCAGIPSPPLTAARVSRCPTGANHAWQSSTAAAGPTRSHWRSASTAAARPHEALAGNILGAAAWHTLPWETATTQGCWWSGAGCTPSAAVVLAARPPPRGWCSTLRVRAACCLKGRPHQDRQLGTYPHTQTYTHSQNITRPDATCFWELTPVAPAAQSCQQAPPQRSV